jgi:hypothetical protein
MCKEGLIHGMEFHDLATELAFNSQEISSKKIDYTTFPIANFAIFNIFHDAMIIHQSVRGLVYNGWSSSGAILVRTLIDLTISLVAIIKSKNPNLAAFRYFNSNHRQIRRDSYYSSELKREIKELIRNQINQLPIQDRQEAYKILQEKDRAYWFWNEWNSPTEVLKEFAFPHVLQEYQQLSSAAHGGFYGLKYFRDRFNDYDITPRLPIGKQAILVSASSSRKMIELVWLRSHFEDLGLEQICSELRESIEKIEGLKGEIL